MNRPLELTGMIFGRLTVLRRGANDKHGQTRWVCRCECGGESLTGGHRLVSGGTKSCGCLCVEACVVRSTIHGAAPRSGKSREYNAWREMKRRCYNPKSKSYPGYGALGIAVSEAWLNDFSKFLTDMGACPERYELDRIDNTKGYSKKNCRWVSEVTQSRNRAYCKLSIDKAAAIRKDNRPSPAIARDYGVSKSQILKVKRGECWVL